MKKSDRAILDSLSDDEKAELLKAAETQQTDAYERKFDPEGKWTDNQAIVEALERLLTEVMGKDSPYQFACLSHLYAEYCAICERFDPYIKREGRNGFKIVIRKWIDKNAPDWQEKSDTFHNRVRARLPHGQIYGPLSGFGKRQLVLDTTDVPWLTKCLVESHTIWNSAGLLTKQPSMAGRIKEDK